MLTTVKECCGLELLVLPIDVVDGFYKCKRKGHIAISVGVDLAVWRNKMLLSVCCCSFSF